MDPQPSLRCARHPDRPALAACVECEALVCPECRRVSPDDGLSRCAACLAADEASAPPPPAAEAPPPAGATAPTEAQAPPLPARPEAPGGEAIPWERSGASTLSALARTAALAARGPARFMARVPWGRGDLRTPLVFAVLCGLIGGVTTTLLSGLAPNEAMPMPPELGDPRALALTVLPLLPLLMTIGLFVSAGISHATLKALKLTRRPFEATFRAFAYAHVALLLLAVPVVGGLLAPLFQLVMMVAGLREAHRLTAGQALLGLAPLFVILLLPQVAAGGL